MTLALMTKSKIANKSLNIFNKNQKKLIVVDKKNFSILTPLPRTSFLQTVHKVPWPNTWIKRLTFCTILSISANNKISECATYFGRFVIALPSCLQTSVHCISLLFVPCACMHCWSGDALLTLYEISYSVFKTKHCVPLWEHHGTFTMICYTTAFG